jgi:hypothetical protein
VELFDSTTLLHGSAVLDRTKLGADADSGARIEEEGLFVVQHKYWQEAMRRALAVETKRNAKD